MEWSDEEGEILPDSIDEYYFVDQSETPVNFCVVPLKWHSVDSYDISGSSVFLRGNTDCGDQSFCKLVQGWNFDLSVDEHPKIEVLLHGMHWVTLQSPKKSYETLVRTTLVSLQFLHFVKRNPDALRDDVWTCLQKLDGIQPSEDDLSDHVSLLCEAMKRDEDLTKSKCLLTFLDKTSQAVPIEVELSTHNQQDAQTPMEQNFIVDNMIDEENSSDDDSETNLQFDPVCSFCDNGGYVLCCEGSCLRSFHPTIADGIETLCESLGFTDKTHIHALATYLCNNCLCKQHQCYACGKLGSSDENSSQQVFPCSASNCGHFYHPKCVARLLCADDQIKSEEIQAKIAARDYFACPLHICKVCNTSEDKNQYALHFAVCRRCPTAYHRKCLPREITSELNSDDDTLRRAWERLLPYNRILIYCLAHEIEGSILTPARDHLIFPDISGQRRTQSHGLAHFKEDVPSREKDPKHHEGLSTRLGICDPYKEPKLDFSVQNVEQRVMGILDEVESSFDFDEFVKSRRPNHIKSYHSGHDISKNITTGLVKTHVNAARAALKMFEEGRDRDARAIFDPDILLELMKHKRKLEIYLSPFLHGMRYTSFGRHFTNLQKLKEIVERLHWYVENGDTVVDFGCGSNDFSCLMNEKLMKTGKTCFFKNFDLIPPKNNFNFEKRDWLSVKPEELPDGSQLIIGLNPPFGHKASLANTFIRKALEFKPKILILIVPHETKRVDLIADYELIWEDRNLLSGMSFYLPGSVDVDNKTIEQWNNIPPPLYLWSRRDWGRSHKTTALQQGHITQMHHSTYNENFHHAEIPRGDADNGMVQDMEISPARIYSRRDPLRWC
ncbi:PREDICTED: protein ENHANCED DOWNY MILDEW 2-like isoform X1 [Camelina sativa]|uniref:Protein ENHANCED DOWNY MILDEW 2-like isoform X1 n=1 Tax=Camelina sativa TaxID=90675 RepID=A0ABM1R935_CAMSA|nr:PREDICTED: protein ENHANCED DOWNY MILDEW 2-like isoform X1 [Camelina sativa]